MVRKIWKLHSVNFIMNEAYDRIINGLYYDKQLKPYTKDFVNQMIDFFTKIEEYEKCSKINEFIEQRFNHNFNYK